MKMGTGIIHPLIIVCMNIILTADADQNGRGLACDDPDQDGHESGLDNCPRIYNPSQDDFDANGQGDACEGDGELIVMSDCTAVVRLPLALSAGIWRWVNH